MLTRRRFLQLSAQSAAAASASAQVAIPQVFSALAGKSQRANSLPVVDTIIVCDGNSLTFGTGATNPYPAQLYTLLGGGVTRGIQNKTSSLHAGSGNPPNTCLNFGVSGQTTAQMSKDAQMTIDWPWFNTTAYPKRRILVAWEGTNSIAGAGLTAAQAWADFQTYCRDRVTAGWYVIACTMITYAGCNETVRSDYNNFIKGGTIGTDFHAVCNVGADNRIYPTFVDPFHLNATGYSYVAQDVAAVIAPLLA